MKKITKLLISIFVFTVLVLPIFSFAQNLIPCGTDANPKSCEFVDIMKLINNVVNFILLQLSLPIAAIMFAYSGFLFMTSGGENAHDREKAKEIFTNVAIGLVLVAGSWLIVHTVLLIAGYNSNGNWFGF